MSHGQPVFVADTRPRQILHSGGCEQRRIRAGARGRDPSQGPVGIFITPRSMSVQATNRVWNVYTGW